MTLLATGNSQHTHEHRTTHTDTHTAERQQTSDPTAGPRGKRDHVTLSSTEPLTTRMYSTWTMLEPRKATPTATRPVWSGPGTTRPDARARSTTHTPQLGDTRYGMTAILYLLRTHTSCVQLAARQPDAKPPHMAHTAQQALETALSLSQSTTGLDFDWAITRGLHGRRQGEYQGVGEGAPISPQQRRTPFGIRAL